MRDLAEDDGQIDRYAEGDQVQCSIRDGANKSRLSDRHGKISLLKQSAPMIGILGVLFMGDKRGKHVEWNETDIER